MWTWASTFISVAAVSALSVAGVLTLTLTKSKLRNLTLTLVSFAVGALLGDAFFHLLPEAYITLGGGRPAAAAVLTGICLFFILEKFLRWRHCHDVECEYHCPYLTTADASARPAAYMNLIGDGVHNFIDGAVIAASYATDFGLGLATTFAVLLHELPQELGDFAILIHSGLSVRRALAFNFLTSLTAAAGAAAVLVLGELTPALHAFLVPLTAGGFIYLAAVDLLPEITHDVKAGRSLMQFGAILAGMALMAALTLIA